MMTEQEAIEIVSYKLGLKKGRAALEEKDLNPQAIEQAIEDQQKDQARTIAARDYLEATKVLKAMRQERYIAQQNDFLKQYQQRENVQALESGLLMCVKHQGQGPTADKADQVEVHYRGTLIDGREFDSSEMRGKPSCFRVSKVIAGWREALLLMPEGSQFEMIVPAPLAYGEKGSGSNVPPHATLIFEVEILKVLKA